MIPNFIPEAVADAEIGWWKAHHERDYDEVIRQMALVYQMQFQLRADTAKKVVMLRIEAAKEHDLAEKEGISEEESQSHWNKARALMIDHFALLKEALIDSITAN